MRSKFFACARRKEQQDAACAVNHLLENRDLVVVSGLADQEDAVVHMDILCREKISKKTIFRKRQTSELAGCGHVHWSSELEKLHVLSGLGYYEAATLDLMVCEDSWSWEVQQYEQGYSGGVRVCHVHHMLRHTMKNAYCI
jgi:hypothetical protein